MLCCLLSLCALAEKTEERQWYIRMAYDCNDKSGCTWYAGKYYTKQYGRGVSVILYSTVPLTGLDQSMLESIVSGQLITVNE